MPLLRPEPCLYPEDLFSDPVYEAGEPWWVLQTRPRAEKTLARQFLSRGDISFYLPTYCRRWRNRGRLFESHLPLFPGYVFLHGNDEVRLRALETNLVAQILPVFDQQELFSDLARVHRLLDTDAPLEKEGRLEPGTLVEITQGPLVGMEGKVIRRAKQLRFLVEVRFLQQGVSVELESWMIQPLHAERQIAAS